MATELKERIVVSDETGFAVWTRDEYKQYIIGCANAEEPPAYWIVTHFDEDEKLLSPTTLSVEEAAGKYATECVGEYSPELQQDWEDVKNHFLAGAAHREKQDFAGYPSKGGILSKQLGEESHKIFDEEKRQIIFSAMDEYAFYYHNEKIKNSTPIPSDIVQALTDANPFECGDDIEGAHYAGWEDCIIELQNILKNINDVSGEPIQESQTVTTTEGLPSQGSVQGLIDALKYVINCGDSCHKCIKKCSEAIDEYSGNQPEKEEEKP